MEQVLNNLAESNPWACALAIAAIATGAAFGVKYMFDFFKTFIRGA